MVASHGVWSFPLVTLGDTCRVWIVIPKQECPVRTHSFDVSFFTYSLLSKQGRWTSSMNEFNWLQVKNFCQSGSEEKQVQIAVTMRTVSRRPLPWLVMLGNRIYLWNSQSCRTAVSMISSKLLLLITYFNQWPASKQYVLFSTLLNLDA